MAILKTIWRKITSPPNVLSIAIERGKRLRRDRFPAAGGATMVMFDKRLAAVLGSCDLAAVVHAIHRWAWFNQAQGKNRQDGQYWAYNSYGDWQQQEFPWVSESTVKRWFLKLEDMGVLVSAQYRSGKGDMRKWYRVDEQRLRELAGGFNWSDGQVNMIPPSGQNGLMVGSKWPDQTTIESSTKTPKRDSQTEQPPPAADAVQEPLPETKNIPVEILRLPRLTARKARELVARYGEQRVLAVVKYAMSADNLSNPAGFVIHELREDRLGLCEEQPKTNPFLKNETAGSYFERDGTNYVTGKYADFIRH